jgi:hypothetical protein
MNDCLEKEETDLMTSTVITNKIMDKLKNLKLLDGIEEHTQDSIAIIMEELIDINIEKITPRPQNFYQNIKLEGDGRFMVRGGRTVGRNQRFKIHLLDVGDRVIVEKKDDLHAHQQFNYYIETHQPNWTFSKERRDDEVIYTRTR